MANVIYQFCRHFPGVYTPFAKTGLLLLGMANCSSLTTNSNSLTHNLHGWKGPESSVGPTEPHPMFVKALAAGKRLEDKERKGEGRRRKTGSCSPPPFYLEKCGFYLIYI